MEVRLAAALAIGLAALASGCSGTSLPADSAVFSESAMPSTAVSEPATASPTPSVPEPSTPSAQPEASPTAVEEAVDELTSECLRARPRITNLDRYWSRYNGSGDEIFIELRFRVTNNCGATMKAFAGDVLIVDAFGDVLASGEWKESLRVKAGETATGRRGYGLVVSDWDDSAPILRDTPVSDLVVEFTPHTVVLANGERIW